VSILLCPLAPDAIRTRNLCLRRTGFLKSGAPMQSINRHVASGGLTTTRFLTLRPLNPRSRFTALSGCKSIALFSASMVQIVGLTVGSNGRWSRKFAGWLLLGPSTYRPPKEVLACFRLKIGSGTARRRHQTPLSDARSMPGSLPAVSSAPR
jgi:hypothetical protein